MDLERIVDTVLSVRSEFEKEVAKFPSLFLEQLKRLKAEAAAAPPGAGGAAEPPPSRKSALARMFQDALVKGVSNYAEAEAFFLRACALASWLLHAAPRFVKADFSGDDSSSARWCFFPFVRHLIEQLGKLYNACIEFTSTPGIGEQETEDRLVRLSAFLANVLPCPAGDAALPPSPLLCCAPGGAPHWALAAWEDRVAGEVMDSLEGSRLSIRPQFVVLLQARASRALVERLLEAAPSGPAAAGSGTAFLRSLRVLYGTRELLLWGSRAPPPRCSSRWWHPRC